jgi:glutamine amidotransferase
VCRLVAYAGRPTPLAPLLFGGSHSLLRQSWAPRELLSGSVNADGWGVAWWDAEERGGPAGPARRLAEARPLWQEEDLEGALEGIRPPLALAALRNATPGIPVDRSGLLPLTLGRWSFVLNGFVPDFRPRHMRALRQTLPDGLYGRLRGSSDSETLFLLAVAEAESGADPGEALLRVSERVRGRVGKEEAQLTMALGTGEELAVLRTSNVAATNSLYLASGHPLAPGGTLVASERLDDDPAWTGLPAHALLRLSATGVEEVRELGSRGG